MRAVPALDAGELGRYLTQASGRQPLTPYQIIASTRRAPLATPPPDEANLLNNLDRLRN
jgi:hypothetical protein